MLGRILASARYDFGQRSEIPQVRAAEKKPTRAMLIMRNGVASLLVLGACIAGQSVASLITKIDVTAPVMIDTIVATSFRDSLFFAGGFLGTITKLPACGSGSHHALLTGSTFPLGWSTFTRFLSESSV